MSFIQMQKRFFYLYHKYCSSILRYLIPYKNDFFFCFLNSHIHYPEHFPTLCLFKSESVALLPGTLLISLAQ